MGARSGFIIGNHIATGGMANVYKAYQPSLKREVAAKQLLPEFKENLEIVQRFKLEAYSLAEMQHPNIVQIYDFDEEQLIFFLEFIQGVTLDELLVAGQGLPVDNCVKILSDVLAGLQYAHDRKLVHRDIKPSNIFITSEGNVKISDFGIAKIIGDTNKVDINTEFGQFIGTSSYASPEQCIGGIVDHRSDIYSSGVLLYHLATGKQPFRGDSQEATRTMQVYQTPVKPTELSGDIPPKLSDIIMRAIAKRPEDRFQSATEFIEAMQEIVKPDNSEVYYKEALQEYDAAIQSKSYVKTKTALLKAEKLCRMTLESKSDHSGCIELSEHIAQSLSNVNRRIYSLYTFALMCVIAITSSIFYFTKTDYGSLDLSSFQQEMEVFLDDRSIGSTPNVFNNIPVGKHSLYVSDSNYFKSKPIEVDIQKNSITAISIPIPSFGKIFINSESPGKEIIVDGKQLSVTPSTVKLPVGMRKITVGKQEQEVTILEGENEPVIFK